MNILAFDTASSSGAVAIMKNDKIIKSVKDVKSGDLLEIRVEDGKIEASVI